MRRAVFLDRDGVINEMILNPDTQEYEPPHQTEDIRLYPYTSACLRKLQSEEYELFLVSNQPDYAKGKVTLDNLKKIHEQFVSIFIAQKISFRDFYYCYHHPKGVVREYSYDCECRKPKPYFLLKAAEDYSLDLKSSWMIGDRDSDILCGQAAGVRTILVDEPNSAAKRGKSKPHFTVNDLSEAVNIILLYSH
ncbi:MAG TPA: HAD family hydrolase [Methanoregulaceae archaeon]|nr:HAD family hydrolase [Methanoregulaceae archaeon]HQN89632.1 HAD family hydrolase [Methanoregulaceae archaeon]HQP81878.1 HAD family hydrolase [Methanoregulaceae archaeon]